MEKCRGRDWKKNRKKTTKRHSPFDQQTADTLGDSPGLSKHIECQTAMFSSILFWLDLSGSNEL